MRFTSRCTVAQREKRHVGTDSIRRTPFTATTSIRSPRRVWRVRHYVFAYYLRAGPLAKLPVPMRAPSHCLKQGMKTVTRRSTDRIRESNESMHAERDG